ncbi:hypothetical protein OSTOST_22592, partial [Ostertagia ostertagi]
WENGRQCVQPCAKCCESLSEKASYVSSEFDSSISPMEERQKAAWLNPLPEYPSPYTSPNPPADALEEYLDASDSYPPKYEDTFARIIHVAHWTGVAKGSRLSGIPEEDSGLGSDNGDPSLGRSRLKLPPPPPHGTIQEEDPWDLPQSRTRSASTDDKRTSAGVPLLQVPMQTSMEEEETSQMSDSLSAAAPKLFVASGKDRQTTL